MTKGILKIRNCTFTVKPAKRIPIIVDLSDQPPIDCYAEHAFKKMFKEIDEAVQKACKPKKVKCKVTL